MLPLLNRAVVTSIGSIRHYFENKDDLVSNSPCDSAPDLSCITSELWEILVFHWPMAQ